MMSARPLPVTATFKPVDYYNRLYPGLTPKDHEFSDCSDGSTESLTSILHHESYASSDDEEADKAFVKETWDKRRGRDADSPEGPVSPQRWPAEGNRAVTKEFVSSTEAFMGGDSSMNNPPDVNGVTAMVYVHQATRQKRFIAAKRPPSRGSNSSSVTPRRPGHAPQSREINQKGPQNSRRQRNGSNAKEEVASVCSNDEAREKETYSMHDKNTTEEEVRRSKDSSSHTTVTETWDQTADTFEDTATVELTAWEKWLLNKERQLRKKQKSDRRQQVKVAEEKERQEKEKQEKLEREKAKVQTWLEHKNQQQREERQRLLAEKKQKEMLEVEEKKKIASKATEKYSEWFAEKQKIESEKKSKDEEERQNKIIQESEKRKKADEAFQKWLSEAKQRPLSVPYSYGFSDGKLTGYYDKSSNPPPSYVNPRPWVHPHPTRVSSRKKS